MPIYAQKFAAQPPKTATESAEKGGRMAYEKRIKRRKNEREHVERMDCRIEGRNNERMNERTDGIRKNVRKNG